MNISIISIVCTLESFFSRIAIDIVNYECFPFKLVEH